MLKTSLTRVNFQLRAYEAKCGAFFLHRFNEASCLLDDEESLNCPVFCDVIHSHVESFSSNAQNKQSKAESEQAPPTEPKAEEPPVAAVPAVGLDSGLDTQAEEPVEGAVVSTAPPPTLRLPPLPQSCSSCDLISPFPSMLHLGQITSSSAMTPQVQIAYVSLTVKLHCLSWFWKEVI